MAGNRSRNPMSVSATELAKLGQCELLVAFNMAGTNTPEMEAASASGNAEHDRFHRRAVLNAGTRTLANQL